VKEQPLPDIDEWLIKQADGFPGLLKMFAYSAKLARARYDAFLAEGFTDTQALELTKLSV